MVAGRGEADWECLWVKHPVWLTPAPRLVIYKTATVAILQMLQLRLRDRTQVPKMTWGGGGGRVDGGGGGNMAGGGPLPSVGGAQRTSQR